jgi:DNA-binding response OmpR family regulator
MATLLREALETQLHKIVLAFNGIEGLEVARSHQFEAIVLDTMLPGMDGFSVAHALRKTAVATPTLHVYSVMAQPRGINLPSIPSRIH